MLKISGPPTTESGAGNHYELVALADLKTYLKIQGTGEDTLLQTLLDNVHRAVYRVTGNRLFKSIAADQTWLLDGNGTVILQLPQYPITTLTSIEEGYVSDAPNTFTVVKTFTSTEYYYDDQYGRIYRRQGGWSRGLNNYRVIWRAGFATVPQDLRDGICQWVGEKLERTRDKRLNTLSRARANESHQWREDEIPQRALDLIMSYRKPGVGVG